MYNLLDNLFARLSEFGRAHQFQSVKLDNVFFCANYFISVQVTIGHPHSKHI